MKSIGIVYGSTTGVTEEIANKIAAKLNVGTDHIHSADEVSNKLIEQYDLLVLGSSTWGCGELQDDWYDAVEILKTTDLSNKTIALFGCGDSASYSDTFCDAIGIIYTELKNSSCTFIGATETTGYDFESSTAIIDNQFIGLVIDDINEPDKTDERIENWGNMLIKNIESL